MYANDQGRSVSVLDQTQREIQRALEMAAENVVRRLHRVDAEVSETETDIVLRVSKEAVIDRIGLGTGKHRMTPGVSLRIDGGTFCYQGYTFQISMRGTGWTRVDMLVAQEEGVCQEASMSASPQ